MPGRISYFRSTEGWGISSRTRSKTSGLAWPSRDGGHLHVGSLGAFQRLGHLVRSPAVGGFAVDGGDDVAGVDAGAERGRALVRRDDIDLIALLLDDHADAVIVAALLFAHPGVGLGIVEIGVRVENAEHAGDGPVVDGRVGLVAVDRLGVVLLHQRIDIGERLEAVAKLALVGRGLRAHSALQYAANYGADGEEENYGEECAAGARSHRRTEPPNGECGRGPIRGFPINRVSIRGLRLDWSPRKIRLARFRQG